MTSGRDLTAEQRNEILRLHLRGLTPQQIAYRVGCSRAVVYRWIPKKEKHERKAAQGVK
jgi:DNA invertase Pin-like site-specific DNA recombinase